MNEKTSKKVRLYFGIALSVMTAIVGALFIWQVLDNYFAGPAEGEKFIFSQDGLFARFTRISPAFWIWTVMIIAGFVLWEVFPVPEKKCAYKDTRYILARMKKRIPETVPDGLHESEMLVKREEKLIKVLWLLCALVGLAGIIYTIVYLAIPSHFNGVKEATHDVLNLAKNVLPWAFATFAVACGVSVYEGISAKKQLEHVKKLSAGNKPAPAVHGRVYEILHHKYFKLGVRIAVGCVSVAFIIAGACNGNVMNILDKAINICSECIGLG